jgi:DNA-binding NarL/FixJ family response regulator
VHAEWPGLGCLILSMHAQDQYAVRSFKAGAKGYVTKDVAPRDLARAVRKVADGGAYVSEAVAEGLVDAITGTRPAEGQALLSDRELEVLRRLTAGDRPTDIALAMHLSIKTVSTHKAHIQRKLGLPSTAALIRYALEHELGDALPLPPRREEQGS